MLPRVAWPVVVPVVMLLTSRIVAAEVPVAFPTLKVPEGFTIEVAAAPPLVERPIVGAFDDQGRLYVAESSGSNDKVEQQLAEKPHRIARLEDTNGDGKFDRRTTFADRMMFPEGALFFDGSLYVAAPPSIWKLTDRDGDGVADERVEWFQGKTLTGCANDLHGPYAGPDGWIYWCKGAFAEQTHLVNGHAWKTTASHVFRCRPDGSGFEPVITAGMDNPVDVAFMPDGERILSGTFFNGNPRQDGLAHAVYGGVWGKEHGVLAGHPRTGELMPLLTDVHSAACCGLERYDDDEFGADYRDNLFLCQFNHRKVSRHILTPHGGTFTCEDHDFVSSDFVDFHPTDVLVDADGSLLVFDTGGWYKLCCPTSQLWKPDVLGGLYRVRRTGAQTLDDPRGRKIDWAGQTPSHLWMLLADLRPAVRQRATREFVRRSESADARSIVARLSAGDPTSTLSAQGSAGALSRAWALAQIESDAARAAIRQLLASNNEQLRHIALQAISLRRDAAAQTMLRQLVTNDRSPAIRRIAAEALGRIDDRTAVPSLLAAATSVAERVSQHSMIYALVELADPVAARRGLSDTSPQTNAAALVALDQMPGGDLTPSEVIRHLSATDDTLRQAALWIVSQHPAWGSELTEWLRTEIDHLPPAQGDAETAAVAKLEALILRFSGSPAIQQLLADMATSNTAPTHVRMLALQLMAKAKLAEPPAYWLVAQTKLITSADATLLPSALAAARALPPAALANAALTNALATIADSPASAAEMRVEALAIVSGALPALSDAQFQLLEHGLSTDNPVPLRAAAADAIANAHLSPPQLARLCDLVRAAGPLELNRLFAPFARSQDEQLGLRLITTLKEATSRSALRVDLLREALAKYAPAVQQAVVQLESLVNVDVAVQRKRIEELLPLVAQGDIRRGHAVFYNTKAVCSSCHRLGYAGGTIGPELSHVGDTRTERDLLESILFPSLSFVRSYEPVLIITQDGKSLNGVIKDEVAGEYFVATGPDQIVRVAKSDVDEIQPSKVSIMPAGLDQQLTPQELADLVTFLKNSTKSK